MGAKRLVFIIAAFGGSKQVTCDGGATPVTCLALCLDLDMDRDLDVVVDPVCARKAPWSVLSVARARSTMRRIEKCPSPRPSQRPSLGQDLGTPCGRILIQHVRQGYCLSRRSTTATQTLGGGAQGHPPLFRYGNVGGRPSAAVLAGSGAGLLSDSIVSLPPAGYFC